MQLRKKYECSEVAWKKKSDREYSIAYVFEDDSNPIKGQLTLLI